MPFVSEAFVVELDVLVYPKDVFFGDDSTEPMIPSPWAWGGLEGSYVGRGAWGIKSYSVPYWEYTKSRYWA